MDLLNFPQILTSVRKVVARCIGTDKVEAAAPTPPAVRPVSATVVKRSKFLGPQTQSDAKVLKRLQMGPASSWALGLISDLKRPRNAIARLRRQGLDLPVQRRFQANSLTQPYRECVYRLSRRDKLELERWERACNPPHGTDIDRQSQSLVNGKGGAR